MRSVYEERVAQATETERRIRQGTDKIVSRKFGAVAKVLWPHNTAAHLGAIAKTTDRAAARWLSGEHDPPITVLLACLHKMFEPESQ